MSKWGSKLGDDGWIHIVPCDADGTIMQPHRASVHCECEPVEDAECPNSILVHQDHERGGENA
jgi:hypothetical protein